MTHAGINIYCVIHLLCIINRLACDYEHSQHANTYTNEAGMHKALYRTLSNYTY